MTITKSNAELSNNGIYEESGLGSDWELGLQTQYQFADKYQFGVALSFPERVGSVNPVCVHIFFAVDDAYVCAYLPRWGVSVFALGNHHG